MKGSQVFEFLFDKWCESKINMKQTILERLVGPKTSQDKENFLEKGKNRLRLSLSFFSEVFNVDESGFRRWRSLWCEGWGDWDRPLPRPHKPRKHCFVFARIWPTKGSLVFWESLLFCCITLPASPAPPRSPSMARLVGSTHQGLPQNWPPLVFFAKCSVPRLSPPCPGCTQTLPNGCPPWLSCTWMGGRELAKWKPGYPLSGFQVEPWGENHSPAHRPREKGGAAADQVRLQHLDKFKLQKFFPLRAHSKSGRFWEEEGCLHLDNLKLCHLCAPTGLPSLCHRRASWTSSWSVEKEHFWYDGRVGWMWH